MFQTSYSSSFRTIQRRCWHSWSYLERVTPQGPFHQYLKKKKNGKRCSEKVIKFPPPNTLGILYNGFSLQDLRPDTTPTSFDISQIQMHKAYDCPLYQNTIYTSPTAGKKKKKPRYLLFIQKQIFSSSTSSNHITKINGINFLSYKENKFLRMGPSQHSWSSTILTTGDHCPQRHDNPSLKTEPFYTVYTAQVTNHLRNNNNESIMRLSLKKTKPTGKRESERTEYFNAICF